MIFNEGDTPNDKCYVILGGRVGIYRGKKHCEIKVDNLESKDANEAKKDGTKFVQTVNQGEDILKLHRLSIYGDLLAKLGFGFLFGETALLNQNNRNATVVALEDTEFMVFHKTALDMIKIYYSKDFAEKKAFILQMVPEMAMISNQLRITQLIEYFKLATVQPGSHLTTEGESSNKVYFVQDGEMILQKNIPYPGTEGAGRLAVHYEQTPLSNLQGKFIIGEECLEGNYQYKYTCIVRSANTKLYVFERSGDFVDFQSFPLFSILLKGFHAKE